MANLAFSNTLELVWAALDLIESIDVFWEVSADYGDKAGEREVMTELKCNATAGVEGSQAMAFSNIEIVTGVACVACVAGDLAAPD